MRLARIDSGSAVWVPWDVGGWTPTGDAGRGLTGAVGAAGSARTKREMEGFTSHPSTLFSRSQQFARLHDSPLRVPRGSKEEVEDGGENHSGGTVGWMGKDRERPTGGRDGLWVVGGLYGRWGDGRRRSVKWPSGGATGKRKARGKVKTDLRKTGEERATGTSTNGCGNLGAALVLLQERRCRCRCRCRRARSGQVRVPTATLRTEHQKKGKRASERGIRNGAAPARGGPRVSKD